MDLAESPMEVGEIFEMSQTIATKTITILRQFFAAYGLQDKIVSEKWYAEEFAPSHLKIEFVTFTVHLEFLYNNWALNG